METETKHHPRRAEGYSSCRVRGQSRAAGSRVYVAYNYYSYLLTLISDSKIYSAK
jgi:hypothetical protein